MLNFLSKDNKGEIQCYNCHSFTEVENNIFANTSNEYSENKIAEILSAYMCAFSQCEWFIRYIKEWLWINEVTGYKEDLMNTVNIYGR